MYKRFSIFAMVLAAVPVLAIGGQVVTDPAWNGSSTISSFGYPNSSTYGEAVTAPAGAFAINDFSFWLQEQAGFQFQAFFATWDNNNYDVGAFVFSPTMTAADGNLDEYTFNLGAMPVTAGTVYMLGVTVDNNYASDTNFGAGAMGGDFEVNGNTTDYFAWSNESGDISQLFSNWNNTGCASNTGSCGQGAFLVDFTTPEPGSMMLFGSGLLLLAGYARRRVKR